MRELRLSEERRGSVFFQRKKEERVGIGRNSRKGEEVEERNTKGTNRFRKGVWSFAYSRLRGTERKKKKSAAEKK